MRPTPLVLLLATVATAAACSGSGHPAAARSPSPSTSPSPEQLPPTTGPDDPLSPRPAVESPAPTGTQRPCAAAALTIADADLLADSTRLKEVFVVRTTGPDCALRGWPVVRLLDAADRPIAATATRVGKPGAVTLSRDSSLSFVLGTPRTTSCTDVSAITVRLPGTDRTIRTSTTMQVCAGRLEIGPLERRQDSEGAEH